MLKNGKVLHDGTRESVFNNRELLNSAGLNPPQIMELSRELNMSPVSYTVDDFVTSIKEQFGGIILEYRQKLFDKLSVEQV
ncbi:hypothetical protein [Oceanobacillus zhaokaii]|uniref:hypothetical protein n=1 Tax=Oceanobacillus zhaokaii TaxID=2052660 RepID=UPI001FA8A330|nr:hypothetical protein [Oceanobacillus zhaokaii]